MDCFLSENDSTPKFPSDLMGDCIFTRGGHKSCIHATNKNCFRNKSVTLFKGATLNVELALVDKEAVSMIGMFLINDLDYGRLAFEIDNTIFGVKGTWKVKLPCDFNVCETLDTVVGKISLQLNVIDFEEEFTKKAIDNILTCEEDKCL